MTTTSKERLDGLDQSDVLRLLRGKSVVPRIATAAKISSHFKQGRFSTEEQRIAEDILRIMISDAEVRVREALVNNLKDCSEIPVDIAEALARDVDQVALPVLEFSPLLKEDFLIEVIEAQREARQMAIASRLNVPTRVSSALIDYGTENTTIRLLENGGAAIDKETLGRALDRYNDHLTVTEAMSMRGELPIVIAERLVTLVSHNLRQHIMLNHALTPETTAALINEVHNDVTASIASDSEKTGMAVGTLVEKLTLMGRLTPAVVLRALCMGNLPFFEAAMARRLRCTRDEVRNLITASWSGIDDLCCRSGLPKHLGFVVRVTLAVDYRLNYEGLDRDLETFTPEKLRTIIGKFEDRERREVELFLRKLRNFKYT